MVELFIALVLAIACAGIVELLHEFHWYPDRWLARCFMRRPSAKQARVFFWSSITAISLIIAVSVHFLNGDEGHKSSPAAGSSTDNQIGDIKNNKGIITQGQKGDNTFPK
jgi:hypothetical protein